MTTLVAAIGLISVALSLLGYGVITGVASAADLGHGMLLSGGGDFALLSWPGVVMVVVSMGKADWMNICSALLKQSWPALVAVSIEPAATSVVRRPTTGVPRTADFRQVRRRQAERPLEASQRELHRSGRPAATAAKRTVKEATIKAFHCPGFDALQAHVRAFVTALTQH